MCETNTITKRLVRLSRRSFNHRIVVANPGSYQLRQLSMLNKELDSLYNLIYDDWTTITENEYKVFGPQLVLLVQTIKDLYDACKRIPKEQGMNEETERLGMNYSALYELNSDIVNFRINAPRNTALQSMMKKAGQALNK